MEHAWEQGKKNKKTGTWQVPQTQEGYDTQWSVDYGLGEDAGKGRHIEGESDKRHHCNAVIGPDDVNRGLAHGAAKDGYPACCGRRPKIEGIFNLRLDDGSKLTCYRCGLHGGQSAGRTAVPLCFHPGCSKDSDGKVVFKGLINDQGRFRYCDTKCKAADAPRAALFKDIRKALGKDDTDVQSKLKDLNAKHNKKDDNMPFDAALAQLNTILAADNVLQALQDALDAGPSGANAP